MESRLSRLCLTSSAIQFSTWKLLSFREVTSDEKVAATSEFTWERDNPATYISSSFVTFDVPLGTRGTFATGINATGQIVGYYIDSHHHTHGFVYSSGIYTTIDDALGTDTKAWGINAARQIVGSYTDSSGVSHGFSYSGGIYTSLDAPWGKNTAVQGINDMGVMVGTYVDGGGVNHGFRISLNGVYYPVDHPLGSKGTIAIGISSQNQTLGSYTDSSGVSHGFLYSGGIYTTLDAPLAALGTTIVTGLNRDPSVVGSYVDSNGVSHGFFYSGGSYYTLDDPLGTTGPMGGISDGEARIGQIVGSYRDSSGEHGLLYSPSAAFKWGNAKLGTGGGNVTYWFDTAHKWTMSEKNALISGLALWSAVANITFSEAASASVANVTFKSNPNEITHTTSRRARPATIGSGTTGALDSHRSLY